MSSHNLNHFIAGAVGGGCGVVATCPLELVKTRLQSTDAANWRAIVNSKPVGLRTFHTLNLVYQSEGIAGLWRGLMPMLIGVVPSRAMYFPIYHQNQSLFRSQLGSGSVNHLVSAFFAGCSVSIIMAPVWTIKTRWQLQDKSNLGGVGKNAPNYRSLTDAVKRMFVEEGIHGFYKGTLLSCIGASEGAIHFMIYEWLKANRLHQRISMSDVTTPTFSPNTAPIASAAASSINANTALPMHEYLMFSAFSRFVATSITYPHEVLRTRQRQGRQRGMGGDYGTIRAAFFSVLRNDGVRGFYSGMGVHLMRVVPNAAVIFAVYENVYRFLQTRSSSSS